MKKTSRNHFSIVSRFGLVFAVVVFVALALFLRGPLASVLWSVAAPLYSNNPLPSFFAQFSTKARLAHENDKLRGELASTTAALADRNVLFEENRNLKQRLNHPSSARSVLAGILLRPPTTPYDTFIVDAGSAHGVVQGALVSAGGTTVIGEIDQVLTNTARVVLFSSPGERHEGLLLESASHGVVPVVVEGHGGGTLTAEVPAYTKAQSGDYILLPGIAGGLTSTVVAVETKNGESSERLYLELPVNPQALRFVEVLSK